MPDIDGLLLLISQTFVTMLVVIDPVGLVPIFIGLAGQRPVFERQRMIKKAVLVSAGIIIVFGLFGKTLLGYLAIDLSAFRIAGGILLFMIALDMIFARSSGSKETPEEEREAQEREDISVFPLAIPLIAGPGTLASIMILINETGNDVVSLTVVMAVTGFILLLCFIALSLSEQISKLIGLTGVNVITRVLGVLLGALAVQYVGDGIVDFLKKMGEG